MKKPPDVIHAWKQEPTITTENWIDLMNWSINKDWYLYNRALQGLLKSIKQQLTDL